MSRSSGAQLLVTGASGFLGRTIIARARTQGLTTFAATRADADQRDAQDLAKLVDEIRPTCAIDAAGVLPGRGDVHENTALTEGWLGAIGLMARPPRLVLIGSAAVYGTGSARDRATREDDPMQPVSDYGRAKLDALRKSRMAFENNGIDVQTGIVFNLIGKGQPTQFVPQAFIRHAIDDPETEQSVGSIEAVRDFADVEDVADALIAMTQRGCKGDIMNVATGQPTRIREVLQQLQIKFGTRWVSENSNCRGPEVEVCYGDPARLMARTGWKPRYDFDAALARAISAAQTTGANKGRP